MTVLVLLLGSAAASAGAQGDRVAREEWMGIHMGGGKVGWTHQRTTVTGAGPGQRWVTAERTEITMRRMGTLTRMREGSRVEEDRAGRIHRFTYWSLQSRDRVELVGRLADGVVTVERKQGGRSLGQERYPVPGDTVGPWALWRRLRALGLKEGNKVVVRTLIPSMPDTTVLAETVVGRREKVDLLGRSRELVRVVQSMRRPQGNITSTLWVDRAWTPWKTVVMGAITAYRLPRAMAQAPVSPREIYLGTMVAPDRFIPRARRAGHLVFRVGLPEGLPGRGLPEGVGQSVRPAGKGAVIVEVRRVAPAQGARLPLDPKVHPACLAASPFLQKDAKEIRSLVAKIAAGEKDSLVLAGRLERWVYANIKKKNMGVGFATALEVARNLEGDCSEHAVLLAALCRSAGIPSRVVAGLLYAPDFTVKGAEGRGAFGFHMWTEVWVGRWVALDATLGRGPADAARIVLARTDLARESAMLDLAAIALYMGRIRIEVLTPKKKDRGGSRP